MVMVMVMILVMVMTMIMICLRSHQQLLYFPHPAAGNHSMLQYSLLEELADIFCICIWQRLILNQMFFTFFVLPICKENRWCGRVIRVKIFSIIAFSYCICLSGWHLLIAALCPVYRSTYYVHMYKYTHIFIITSAQKAHTSTHLQARYKYTTFQSWP